MSARQPDVTGIIAGTVLAGGATVWLLNEYGAIDTDQLGLAAALVLVVSGIVGLGASGRR
ncbi:MAG TPA: hypothetical protein VGJ44_03990 [Kribbellaceae bacterium]